jgi:RimJ/RimL family protein N-acetyltransferase
MIKHETKRLFLRKWLPQDIEQFLQINNDPLVIEYLLAPLSRQDVEEWIKKFNTQFEERGYTLWALELKTSAKLIGFTGLNYTNFEAPFTPAVEVGWRLGSQHWGKGYATEAAKFSLDYGFNKIGLEEIVSFTVPKNTKSIHVMERLGLKRDIDADFLHPKISRDHKLSKHVLYRITKADFNS